MLGSNKKLNIFNNTKRHAKSLFGLVNAQKLKKIQTRKHYFKILPFLFKHLKLSKRPKNDLLLIYFVKETQKRNVAFDLCSHEFLWSYGLMNF